MSDTFVSSDKLTQLRVRMLALGILDAELTEKFITGSGKGGQKINKTSSCVYIKHEPTGIEVKCQRERSRELNRYLARRELCDRIDEQRRGLQSKRQQEYEKVRRQKRRRSRRQKANMLADKHHHADKKQHRGPIRRDE